MELFRSYKIKSIEQLGNGAFGYVEKIELYNSLDMFCGYYGRKVLSPSSEILASISLDEIKRRFTREVIYQSNCSGNYVTSIYLFNNFTEKPYFVMELAENSLDKDIESELLDDKMKFDIVMMILYGVKIIHDKGYLHRDIKPQNILKFSNGNYKISDFGLVKNTGNDSASTVLTAIGQTMGTRRYMAPEILYDAAYSKQTDIFSLGKVMEDLRMNACYHSIIQKCCAMKEKERYKEVSEIIDEIGVVGLKDILG